MTTESQNNKILRFLRNGGKLTPIKALNKFGCFRLSGRIFDIKQKLEKDEAIETSIVDRNGKRVAEYKLVKAA